MQKKYYIKDIEKTFGVGRTTIFYWESTGKIPKAKRTPMGNFRWWTVQDVKRLRRILNAGWR